MNCSVTMSFLDDARLFSAVLDREITEAAKDHFARCGLCRKRLATYHKVNGSLLAALYRSECPSSMQLSAYCTYRLSEMERLAVEAHLQSCPLCTREVNDTLYFLAAVRDVV